MAHSNTRTTGPSTQPATPFPKKPTYATLPSSNQWQRGKGRPQVQGNRSPPRASHHTGACHTPHRRSLLPTERGSKGRHSRAGFELKTTHLSKRLGKKWAACIFFCKARQRCVLHDPRPRQELARPRSPPPANLNRIRRVSLVELISVLVMC